MAPAMEADMCTRFFVALVLTFPVILYLTGLQAQAKTVMGVAMDGQAIGLIGVADHVRATSHEMVTKLQALGIEVAMLTAEN